MLNKNKFEEVLARTINKNSNQCPENKTFGGLDADSKGLVSIRSSIIVITENPEVVR